MSLQLKVTYKQVSFILHTLQKPLLAWIKDKLQPINPTQLFFLLIVTPQLVALFVNLMIIQNISSQA